MAMTRSEFALKLASRMGLLQAGGSAADAEAALRKAGITRTQQGAFRGGDVISRAEAATMFVRANGGDPSSVDQGLQQAHNQGLFTQVGDGTAGFEQAWFAHVADSTFGPDQTQTADTPTDPVQDAEDAATRRAAEETLSDKLTRYGLESLIPWAFEQLRLGTSVDTIVIQLQDQQPFKDRFKGLEMRRQNGYPALTPADYLAVETGFKQTLHTAGIPSGFYDSNDELAQFIGNDVSAAEFTDRVSMARSAVNAANPELKKQLLDMYGVGAAGDGELVAYFLDPTRAVDVIEQRLQMESAGLSAATVQAVGTGLDKGTARSLADLNVQQREIGATLGQQAGLVQHQLLGEQKKATSSELAAASFGLDSEATAQIRRLRQRRQQAGVVSSGALATQSGVVGLGGVQRQG